MLSRSERGKLFGMSTSSLCLELGVEGKQISLQAVLHRYWQASLASVLPKSLVVREHW